MNRWLLFPPTQSLTCETNDDGWEHTDITDICAIHDYTPTAAQLEKRYDQTLVGAGLPQKVWIGQKPLFARGSKYRGQPIMLSEVGVSDYPE